MEWMNFAAQIWAIEQIVGLVGGAIIAIALIWAIKTGRIGF